MACFYYKDGVKYTNPKDMIMEFLRDDSVLKATEGSIFSSSEIQDNIVERIARLHNPEAYDSGSYTTDLDFISEPNWDFFKGIEGLENVRRLTPQYIESERSINFVLSNLDSDVEVEKGKFVSQSRLEHVLTNPQIARADIDLVKTILSEYEGILEIEEGTKELARILKYFIIAENDGKAPPNMDDIFDNIYTKPNAVQNFGKDTPGNRRRWYDKIIGISRDIKTKVSEKGKVLTDLKLVSTTDSDSIIPKVSSKIDLLAVDTSGDIHLFEIKTSKKRFDLWDSSKKLTNDWALAIKKQMLGQTVNVENIKLYTIPITVTALGDPDNVILQDMAVRTNDQTAGLRQNGKISVMADRLLPRKIFVTHDPNKIVDIQNKVKEIIADDYEVNTEIAITDVNKIVELAEKSFKRNDNTFKYYNNYVGVDGIPKGYMTVKPKSLDPADVEIAKKQFTRMAETYVEHAKRQGNQEVSVLFDAINQALTTNEQLNIGRYQQKLRHILYEYLNKDWEVVNIKEGIPMGMIVLRNKYTGIVNLFSISVDQFLADVKADDFSDSSLTDYTYRDIDVIKSMIFLNEFKDQLLPNKGYKMGQILTFNPKSGDNHFIPMRDALKLYTDRMFEKGLEHEIKIKKSDFSPVQDMALYDFYAAVDSYEGEFKDDLISIINSLGEGHVSDISKERLETALENVYSLFPDYIDKTLDTKINFGDQVEVIIALLQTSILSKSKVDLHADFRGLTKYSFQYADFKSLLTSIYKKKGETYDKHGNKVQGLFQGLTWSSPEHIQSKDIRQINTLISNGNTSIGQKFIKASDVIRQITKNYYDAIDYGEANKIFWGETRSKYKDFYLPGNEYITKNPYKLDAENGMSDLDRNHLKQMLFQINRYVLGITDVEAEGLDPNSLDSLMSNEKIARALESGEYFQMPLMRNEEMSKYSDSFKSNNGRTLNIQAMTKDNIISWIDGRELSKHDLLNIRKQSRGFFQMYNPYGNQRGSIRAKMLQDRGANYYEMNLDTIAHKVAFARIRKQTFDKILPTINSYIWWIKLIGGKNSTDPEMRNVEKTIEYIVNQVKLAVMDDHLIGDEEHILAKSAGFVKKISTVAMLAFRPALTAKELTIGLLKNFTASGIKLDPEYNMKNMTNAYKKLITIDKKFSTEFNLIERINHFYKIANMDTASMSSRIQSDRLGVAKGLGHFMFMTSTIGDYYNRMAMLLAKMHHEGSYEAHSLVNGELHYDPRKDKRFSKYLAERHNHKNSKGEYIPKEGDVEYNTQRRRYLWTMNQINSEGVVTNETKLTEGDLLPKAYSHLERNSVKAQADMMYGAYDKDAQSHINNTLFGIAFMQFLTYWPNKMKFYFGKRVEGEDSPIGQVKQATKRDADGNEQLLWNKYSVDENGMEQLDITTENTGDPVWEFVGTPQEGAFTATLGIIQDVFRNDWSSIKNDKLRNRRAVFGLIDAGLLFLILGLMRKMWDWIVGNQDEGSVSKELTSFMQNVNEKVYREQNVWENTFGAINTEPLWLNWSRRTMRGVQDAITGDNSIGKMAVSSVGALEMFR